MQILERISDANGWVLTVTGIGTVFLTLVCIWLFLSVFSKLTDKKPKENPGGGEINDCECAEVEPIKDAIPPQQNEEPKAMQNTETTEQEQVLDDTIPKMAAAAAVAAYVKRSKRRAYVPAPPVVQASPWVISSRSQSLHNLPQRNPWKGNR